VPSHNHLGQALVVTCEASVSSEPTKRSFNHSTTQHPDKSLARFRVFPHLQFHVIIAAWIILMSHVGDGSEPVAKEKRIAGWLPVLTWKFQRSA
jgi:hypothetical protein